MRSTRFWAVLVGGILLAAAAAAVLVGLPGSGTVAEISVDGVTVRTVELDRLAGTEVFTVEGPAGGNTIEAEQGRIRVRSADCPDQICVHQGWIDGGGTPIVCLPNRLVITIRDAGIDGVTG